MTLRRALRWLVAIFVCLFFLWVSYLITVLSGWSFTGRGWHLVRQRSGLLAIAAGAGAIGIAAARLTLGRNPLSCWLLGALVIPSWGAYAVLL